MVKKILFGILATILFFVAVESILILIDYEGVSEAELKATAGFPENSYVHRRDRIYGDWFITDDNIAKSNPYLLSRGFHLQQFPVSTPSKRVFAIGGSTTFGSPFEHEEKGFPERLDKRLGEGWEVINAGVAGMDSSAFPKLTRELVSLDADYLIIYSGNNEIRGRLIEACTNPYRVGFERQFSRLRTVQLIREQIRRFHQVGYQFDALAERQQECLLRQVKIELANSTDSDTTERQDLFYNDVLQSFSVNIQKTIDIAKSKDLTVILVIPPINLQVAPEFSLPHSSLAESEHRKIEHLHRQKLWEDILQIDSTYAIANYEVGIKTSSSAHLWASVQRDYLTKRITPELQAVLVDICENNEITCVNLQKIIEERGITGFFTDFCHPTFETGVDLIVSELVPHLK